MNNVIQYLDSLVTTINPGLNVQFPEHHPSLQYLQDYVELFQYTELKKSDILNNKNIAY